MDDARRCLVTLGLALALATPGIAGPAADPADDEAFAEFLEFLGDPALADDGWGAFLDGFLGAGQDSAEDGGAVPPPTGPEPPAGGTP